MGAVLTKGIDGISFVARKVIIPLAKLALYIVLVCFVFSVLANLAGILGLIIFMIVFYHYIKGIIFIEPNSLKNQASMQNNISNAIFGNNSK